MDYMIFIDHFLKQEIKTESKPSCLIEGQRSEIDKGWKLQLKLHALSRWALWLALARRANRQERALKNPRKTLFLFFSTCFLSPPQILYYSCIFKQLQRKIKFWRKQQRVDLNYYEAEKRTHARGRINVACLLSAD